MEERRRGELRRKPFAILKYLAMNRTLVLRRSVDAIWARSS